MTAPDIFLSYNREDAGTARLERCHRRHHAGGLPQPIEAQHPLAARVTPFA
jgi:hypothetical protein